MRINGGSGGGRPRSLLVVLVVAHHAIVVSLRMPLLLLSLSVVLFALVPRNCCGGGGGATATAFVATKPQTHRTTTTSVAPSTRIKHIVVLGDDKQSCASSTLNAVSQAKEIMETIQSRYDNDNNDNDKTQNDCRQQDSWTKTRNYVYQATSRSRAHRLTLQQVHDVLSFLDESCTLALCCKQPSRLLTRISYFCTVVSLFRLVFAPSLVRSILTVSPRILKRNVSYQLKPTVQFLQELYGPRNMFQEAISRNPDLLLSSGISSPNTANAVDKVDRYLRSQTVGLTASKIAKLRKKAPFLFRLSPHKIQEVVDFLDSLLAMAAAPRRGESNESNDLHDGSTNDNDDYDKAQHDRRRTIGKIVMSHPVLMNLSVEKNLKPRVAFLMERCQLQDEDAARLVKSSSGIVLGLSVEENLRPTLDFLSNLLARRHDDENDPDGVLALQLKKCVLRHPQLLALSLENLQAKVAYFDAIDRMAGFSSSETMLLACRVAVRSPAVYSLSLKNNIVPTVEFLAKTWGTISPDCEWHDDVMIVKNGSASNDECNETLSSLLKEFPSILTMSLEGNIQPTLTFFNRTGYTRLDDEWRLQSDNTTSPIRGRYIAASLFNRLLPRWHHIIANGWSLGEEDPPDPSMLPPLHLLVGATDGAFCEQHGYDYESYLEFKDESIPRLKFSSQFDTWLKTGRPIDIQ